MCPVELEKILACPRCKTPLKKVINKGKCPKCQFLFKKIDGIWHMLYLIGKKAETSAQKYNKMHQDKFFGPNDGSYEVLGRIARGNRTVDIACGEGLIERFAPETVGVEFSINALKKARKKGAKQLVLADAQTLPFTNDSFDVSISAGSLEHFTNPQKAVLEMARISKIQLFTVHRYLTIPFAAKFYQLASVLFNTKHQPIEQPITQKRLEIMIKEAGLHIVFKGVWTLPVNYGRVIKLMPELKNIPACLFIISIKK